MKEELVLQRMSPLTFEPFEEMYSGGVRSRRDVQRRCPLTFAAQPSCSYA